MLRKLGYRQRRLFLTLASTEAPAPPLHRFCRLPSVARGCDSVRHLMSALAKHHRISFYYFSFYQLLSSLALPPTNDDRLTCGNENQISVYSLGFLLLLSPRVPFSYDFIGAMSSAMESRRPRHLRIRKHTHRINRKNYNACRKPQSKAFHQRNYDAFRIPSRKQS